MGLQIILACFVFKQLAVNKLVRLNLFSVTQTPYSLLQLAHCPGHITTLVQAGATVNMKVGVGKSASWASWWMKVWQIYYTANNEQCKIANWWIKVLQIFLICKIFQTIKPHQTFVFMVVNLANFNLPTCLASWFANHAKLLSVMGLCISCGSYSSSTTAATSCTFDLSLKLWHWWHW